MNFNFDEFASNASWKKIGMIALGVLFAAWLAKEIVFWSYVHVLAGFVEQQFDEIHKTMAENDKKADQMKGKMDSFQDDFIKKTDDFMTRRDAFIKEFNKGMKDKNQIQEDWNRTHNEFKKAMDEQVDKAVMDMNKHVDEMTAETKNWVSKK